MVRQSHHPLSHNLRGLADWAIERYHLQASSPNFLRSCNILDGQTYLHGCVRDPVLESRSHVHGRVLEICPGWWPVVGVVSAYLPRHVMARQETRWKSLQGPKLVYSLFEGLFSSLGHTHYIPHLNVFVFPAKLSRLYFIAADFVEPSRGGMVGQFRDFMLNNEGWWRRSSLFCFGISPYWIFKSRFRWIALLSDTSKTIELGLLGYPGSVSAPKSGPVRSRSWKITCSWCHSALLP